MDLELEFCENNQKISEALENMKLILITVKIRAINGLILCASPILNADFI
jgi:hypothetical protein